MGGIAFPRFEQKGRKYRLLKIDGLEQIFWMVLMTMVLLEGMVTTVLLHAAYIMLYY